MRTLFACALLAGAFGCSTTTSQRNLPPLQTVQQFDLPRYLGTWYEIAAFPQSAERDCYGSRAEYTLQPDQTLRVLNRCRKGSLQGPESAVEGRARVPDSGDPAKLKVSFFGPFWGDYWIIALGDQYEYAVVGHPSRDYLWILSRTPHMEPQQYNEIVALVAEEGYDVARLRRMPQD